MNTIILATNNTGKIKEMQAILAPIPCVGQREFEVPSVQETGLTFVENAIIKARHASMHTNKPVIADDSGLVVPAIQGEPGIYSARFAKDEASDAENIEMLLKKMQHISDNDRHAFFYCALVFMEHARDPTPIIACGQVNGIITRTAHGKKGFGYDPVFYLPAYKCTMAELPLDEKNSISHRAKALRTLLESLL